jgi:hypothetical protein
MKKALFLIFVGWLGVCAFSVFDINIIENAPVEAVFGEIIDDEKTITVDFTRAFNVLASLKLVQKDAISIPKFIFTQKEFVSILFQCVSFFVLGIIMVTIFNLFSKTILFPTIFCGGIIVFLLHYFKILTLSEIFNWVKFYMNYLSLGASAIIGTLLKKLRRRII